MRLERRYQGRGGGRRQGLDLERKGEEEAMWLEWKKGIEWLNEY
jgi:hypothetical protein